MSVYHEALMPSFKACPADGIRTEFGVCRGDAIQHVQDLILGDTFLPRRDAQWSEILSDDENHGSFTLSTAANAPQRQLVVLAELIFMSTTGRRMDVFAAAGQGKLYFVSNTAFQTNVEYVLIDIQRREDAVVPAIIPDDMPIKLPMHERAKGASASHLRMIG